MDTLTLALEASGCDRAEVGHKPRLLSDNGSSYIAGELADWLEEQGIDHVRGAPYHPQTQGKIERWHQTLKNRILLENYYLPGDLKASIGAFVERYNHHRYHESLGNLTPADVYCGRDRAIIEIRRKIKKQIAKTTLGAPTPSRLTADIPVIIGHRPRERTVTLQPGFPFHRRGRPHMTKPSLPSARRSRSSCATPDMVRKT